MKRSPLGPGVRSLERGSTFENTASTLKRSELARKPTVPRRRPISPASREQRDKTRHALSIVSGQPGCDPCHIVDRSMGGCDDPLCVVPLTREEHRAYDEHELDLLPYMIAQGKVAELQHALGHMNGDLIGLANRLCGERFVPEAKEHTP